MAATRCVDEDLPRPTLPNASGCLIAKLGIHGGGASRGLSVASDIGDLEERCCLESPAGDGADLPNRRPPPVIELGLVESSSKEQALDREQTNYECGCNAFTSHELGQVPSLLERADSVRYGLVVKIILHKTMGLRPSKRLIIG